MDATVRTTAVAHPNIALIKYWGDRDHSLRLPANGSLSLTLAGLETVTSVTLDDGLDRDTLTLNDEPANPQARNRVSRHLDLLRDLADSRTHAHVHSASNFPADSGVASSAAAFAALTLAGASAFGLSLDRRTLSRLARRGSGSASRSIFGGFVELHTGRRDEEAYAEEIAPKDHWSLVDLIAVVSREQKDVGSTRGHQLAGTSPLQQARIKDTPRRLKRCRQAILGRDFEALAAITEQDSNLMHAVMQTSAPALLYWRPETLRLMLEVQHWRAEGLEVCYTIDAGPNVHCICTEASSAEIEARLAAVQGALQVLAARPGSGAHLLGPSESSR